LLVFFGLLGFGMWEWQTHFATPEDKARWAKADREAAAKRALEARDPKSGFEVRICRRAQEYVAAMLKAPSTSDFPSCVWRDDVHYAGDGRYNFSSYVDAENSFGAKIRTYYDGEALIEGPDRAHLSYQFTRFDTH
jgi:hypothetical protein